jgi:hypothetical protein
MHVFALWFCWFFNLFFVPCVAVLNVFVGAETCLAVSHYGHSLYLCIFLYYIIIIY